MQKNTVGKHKLLWKNIQIYTVKTERSKQSDKHMKKVCFYRHRLFLGGNVRNQMEWFSGEETVSLGLKGYNMMCIFLLVLLVLLI